MKKILLVTSLLSLCACTDNERARNFGGTETVTLDPGKQLVNCTWKESDVWILTKAADSGHTPTTYSLKEKSAYGMMNGEIVIKEQ